MTTKVPGGMLNDAALEDLGGAMVASSITIMEIGV